MKRSRSRAVRWFRRPGYVGFYENFEEITTRRGLLNGQSPASVYSLWNNAGVLSNNYSKFNQQQIRVSATGAADVGKHAINVGVNTSN
ncbi:MAG: hypothetical protein IPP33_08450 [Flavobacteriales bacterium]|nr:hypothetical protein [Flavobacteriales bacterium]